MKPSITSTTLILIVMIVSVVSVGHFEQLTQGYTGAPGETTCNSCHDSPTNEVMSGDVELQGMPAYVVGGKPYPMTLVVYTNNTVAQNTGFQLTMLNEDGTSNGQLTGSDPNVDIQTFGNRQYAQHSPGVQFFEGAHWDTVWFHFTWTPAPVTQPELINSYYAALLGNGNYMEPGGHRLDSTLVRSYETTVIPALTASIEVLNAPTCFGDTDGSLEVQLAGGLTPIQITWSNGEHDPIITGLAAGEYAVTLEDAAGQVVVLEHQLGQPVSLQMDVSVISPSCHDTPDGVIDIFVQGGTPPYALFINGQPASLPALDVPAGTYALELFDDHGCDVFMEFDVTAPQEIDVQVAEVGHQTAQNNGFIIVEPEGGTPPYAYYWEGPNQFVSFLQNPTQLEAGTYTLTLTDDHGCEDFLAVELDFISATSHADEMLRQVRISPNPGTSHFIIELPETSNSEWVVTAYTHDGKKVWMDRTGNAGPFKCDDAARWQPGLYLIQIEHPATGESITLRWIKSRL